MPKSKGTTGHRMVKVDKTQFIPKIAPPSHMTGEAKKIWVELVDATPNDNLLPSDFPLLESYCCMVAGMRRAEKHLQEEGDVITFEGGRPFKNPWVDIKLSLDSKISTTSSKLRLNPAARMDKTIVKGQQAESQPTTDLGKLING